MFQHNFLVPCFVFFFHNAKRQRHSWFVTKQTEGFSSGAKRQARHRDLNNKVTLFIWELLSSHPWFPLSFLHQIFQTLRCFRDHWKADGQTQLITVTPCAVVSVQGRGTWRSWRRQGCLVLAPRLGTVSQVRRTKPWVLRWTIWAKPRAVTEVALWNPGPISTRAHRRLKGEKAFSKPATQTSKKTGSVKDDFQRKEARK